MNYEMLLHIIAEEAIGWDMRNNKVTDKPGYFGIPYALSKSTEEQGRTTLHSHWQIWIRGISSTRKVAFHGDWNNKTRAKDTLAKYHDHVATTSLFSNHSEEELQTSNSIRSCRLLSYE